MNEETRATYTEVWQLHKHFHEIRKDGEWEMLIEKSNELLKRHNSEFARDLVNAMLGEIERRTHV